MPNTVINVTLTGDSEIHKLNNEHLGRDFTTDVLSFSINETLENGDTYLGDVIVNSEQAQRQAEEYGNTKEQEIAELVAHGVLHLLGVHHEHDDEKDVHGIPVKEQ